MDKVARNLAIVGLILYIIVFLMYLRSVNTEQIELRNTITTYSESITKLEETNKNLEKEIEDTLKTLEETKKALNEYKSRLVTRDDVVSRGGITREFRILEEDLKKFKKLDMRATAYDLSVESCGKLPSHPEYGITRSGEYVILGTTVAVDPNTIPLGSLVYLELHDEYSYLNGIYRAMDTGSAVKGNIIDIYVGENEPNLTYKFGIRPATVYIIE